MVSQVKQTPIINPYDGLVRGSCTMRDPFFMAISVSPAGQKSHRCLTRQNEWRISLICLTYTFLFVEENIHCSTLVAQI